MNKRKGYTISELGAEAKRRLYDARIDEVEKLMLGFDPGFDDKTLMSYVPSVKTDPTMESDDELRARIVYVAGEREVVRRLQLGVKLDAIAEEYGLKRRKRDREETQPVTRVWK